MKVEVELTFVKSTKGTLVYGNEALGITGLYFPKLLLGAEAATNPPAKLKLTIEDAKA